MALVNLPSISAPGVQDPTFNGFADNGGSATTSQSVSKSRPVFTRPDVDSVQDGFNTLQGGINLNGPQQRAVEVQQSLGQTLQSLLADAETQGSTRIQQGFQGASDEAAQALISRGLDPSQVNQTAQTGAAREAGLATGDMMDQLLNRNVQSNNQVSGEIANLLFGSSDQATDLINALLGSGSIGNISQSGSASRTVSNTGL